MPLALELDRVTRCYGRRKAIADVSLRLESGRSMCLVGQNGAGKSTLLALMAGAIMPDCGQIRALGLRLDESDEARRDIGYMSDHPLVYEALSGYENLAFFGRLFNQSPRRDRLHELLNLVGLAERADEPAGAYSAGMKRRLDLARVLLHEPKLLVLDEPFLALDPAAVDVMLNALRQYRSGERSFVFSAHSAASAAGLVDYVMMLERGRLVACAGDRLAGGPGVRP